MPVLNPIPTPAYTATSATNSDTYNPRAHMYNDPSNLGGTGAVPSTLGVQTPTAQAYHLKTALTEAAKKRKFGKLADSWVVILAKEIYTIFPEESVILADKFINLEPLTKCLLMSSLNLS